MHQVQKRRRSRGPVRVHIPDQIRGTAPVPVSISAPPFRIAAGNSGTDFGELPCHSLRPLRACLSRHPFSTTMIWNGPDTAPENTWAYCEHGSDASLLVVGRDQAAAGSALCRSPRLHNRAGRPTQSKNPGRRAGRLSGRHKTLRDQCRPNSAKNPTPHPETVATITARRSTDTIPAIQLPIAAGTLGLDARMAVCNSAQSQTVNTSRRATPACPSAAVRHPGQQQRDRHTPRPVGSPVPRS